MKRFLFLLPFLSLFLFSAPESAQTQNTTCPTRPAGDSSNACASTAFVSKNGFLTVANNAALIQLPPISTSVARLGYTTSLDGGYALYNYSSSPCSAADNGAQVSSSFGGCWIASFDSIGSTNIKVWGAPTDGVHDDTPAANLGFAYLNSKGGGKLYLPGGVKVVFNELTMPYNGLSIECPWTDATQILPGSGSGNTIIMGSGTGVGAATVTDLEVNNCTFVPKTGNVQTGGSYVIINNANTTRLTNTRHFGGYKPISITNNSVINYVTQADFVGTASNNGVDITIAGGGDQFLSNINAVGASGGTQPNACINIQESGGVWLTNIDCISQGDGLLINPTGGKQVLWTFGSNIAFDTGLNGLNVNPTTGGIVKGLSISGLWTSSNTNWGATFTGSGGGSSIDQVELVGHRSYNNGRDGAVIAFGGNYTINGGSYCGNSAATPSTDSGINIGVGMTRVSVLNARIGTCVGYGSTQLRGIILQPSAATNNILIAGNDLTGNVNPVFNGVTTPGGVVIFSNNIGYPDSAFTTINGITCAINASCVVGSGSPTGAAGGALSGTYPNPGLVTVSEIHGGTNQTTYTLGDTLYSSAANTLAKLAGNTTTTRKFFSQTGTGTVSAAPILVQPACADISNATALCSAAVGTGVVTALGVNVGSAGAFVVNGGALGTPSSGTGTNIASLNASNLSAGTVAAARGGAGTVNGALKGDGAGNVAQAACSNLSDGATGCSTATGTSGATIPLNNTANTHSALQTFSAGTASTISGQTAQTIDASGQPNITVANGGNATIAFDNMGFVIITDTTTGHTAMYLLTSGLASLIAMDTGWSISTTPPSGSNSIAWDNGGFRFAIYNNTGASHQYKLINFRTH